MSTDQKLIDDPVGIELPDQARTQDVSIPEPFDPLRTKPKTLHLKWGQ